MNEAEEFGVVQAIGAPRRERVLVVDDEPMVARTMGRLLSSLGLEVEIVHRAEAALDLMKRSKFDGVISDIVMPGMGGLQLLREIRREDLDIPVIFVTGAPDVETAIEAIEYGAFRYFKKPFDVDELKGAVKRAVKLRRLAELKRQAAALSGVWTAVGGDFNKREATFNRALSTLWMAYQPIVAARDFSVIGYEALLRTDNPELANPTLFVSCAQRLDRLDELGLAIRSQVAATARANPDCGLLFINLHPREIYSPDLVDLEGPLTTVASRVVLEITERSSIGSTAKVAGRLEELRALGFSLAVDDLGSGYAGLTSFAAIRPQVVKIDMSLTRDVDSEGLKQRLIASMTQVCRDMGIQVVAEGIETKSERDTLVQLGVDLLQGYLFAKPGKPFPRVQQAE